LKKERIVKNEVKALKALGDETRLRIAYLLMKNGDLCVCEIEDALKMKQSSISKALKVLKEADVIQDNRKAQWKYYSLKNAADNPGFRIMRTLVEKIEKSGTAKQDIKNLKICLKQTCKRR